MQYGELRWTDIDRLDKSNMVAVCPLASMEQHGHHLPLLTDTILATGVAERVHDKLPDRVLLAPTLWLGASDHHLDFPGTISVPNSLYVEMIKSVTRSLVRGGFRRIFFLNGHGGNVAPGESAISEMANSCDRCDEAFIALGSYWAVASAAMAPERHGMESPRLTHACEYETSMMLHLREDLVAMDHAAGSETTGASSTDGVRVAGRFHRMTKTGALGRPELAAAEKGASLLEAIAEDVAGFVRQLADWPMRAIAKEEVARS